MNIFKWLQSLIPTLTPPTPLGFIGETGVERNPEDPRDIQRSAIVQARKPKDKFITDISMIAVEDQQDKGTCVGQAEGGVVKFYLFKILGTIVNISHRSIYVLSKAYDGMPFEGTIPRIAALVITKYFGASTVDKVPDINDAAYPTYMDLKLTGTVLDDAAKNKLPGFAFISANEGEVTTAIEDHGVVPATIGVDFSKWYTAFIARLLRIEAFHRVFLYGHELVGGRRKIYFRNSWGSRWGDNGNGWFWLDEYKDNLYDMHVYMEIPADLLKKAQTEKFTFNPTQFLKYGDEGFLVYKMQQRLQESGYLKNVDIANMEPYYGNMTAAALLSYQLDNHIDSVPELQNVAGRSFGPKTINFMNANKDGTVKKNLLVAWANAIQSFEGYSVGSRSYRNRNPGNLRSWHTQIGMDGGFAIFASYEDGFNALKELLTNAATGKSTVYKPTMTLLDFYHKYAPSTDGNYPQTYAKFVATKMGVTVDTKIGTFV